MTIPFLKIRSKPGQRGLVTTPQQREKLTVWVVEDLPYIFGQILQWLSRRQLLLLIVSLLLLFIPLITARPPIWQQGLLGFILFLVGRVIIQMEEDKPKRKTSEYLHLLLVLLSGFTTLRYFYYRTRYTLNFEGWLNIVFCLLLYGAEFYAIATLFLAYFQTLKIKQRQAVSLETIPQKE